MTKPLLCTGAAAAILLTASCATAGPGREARSEPAICHVALVTLKDPADAPALIAACRHDLAPIPGVTTFQAGPRLDTGRANVEGGYDIGLYIGFASASAYVFYTT